LHDDPIRDWTADKTTFLGKRGAGSMKLLRSSALFGGMTLLSRVAGLVRDQVQAALFGASAAMDAFLIAYRIPNLFRRIFAEGSFAQAFVPVFTDTLRRGSRDEVRDLLDHVAGALGSVLLIITALGIAFAPAITAVFAPGALDEPVKFALTTDMLRITFPYLFLISMVSLAGAVLNSHHHFGLPALVPVLHNLTIIAAALFLAPRMEVPAMALAWGVAIAGVLQLLVLWPALLRLGLLPRFRIDWRHPGVRRVFRLMLPTLFSSSAAQINLIVGTVFASLLVTGSQTWLYLSDRLIEFPLGVFGVALGTVILPHLARRNADEDRDGYAATLNWGVQWVLLLALPAALGLFLLAEPLSATIFQYGRFTPFDTRMAALAIAAMSIGVPGFMLTKVLAPAFFARQDARTPMRAALKTVAFNLLLTIALVTPLWHYKIVGAHAGIAFATALAGLFNAWLLWRALRRQGHSFAHPEWPRVLRGCVLGLLLMIASLMAMQSQVGAWGDLAPVMRVLLLLATVGLGAGAYLSGIWLAGVRPRHLREPT